jgi:heavy metal sensor kinase
MKKTSIGFRLAFWYFAIFAFTQLAFGFGLWFFFQQKLYGELDKQLSAQVEDLQHFLEAQKPHASISKLQEEVAEAYDIEHAGDFLQIYDSQGAWIYRSKFLLDHWPANSRTASGQTFDDRNIAGQSLRFVSQTLSVHGHVFFVDFGMPSNDQKTMMAFLLRCLLFFAPFMLVAASIIGYWLSSRALAPVDVLTRTARTINGGNLSRRLESPKTNDELQRLADTLNQMLERIETAFRHVTEFTADASHELRTPISLIRTEAEIALRRQRTEAEYREALRHILQEAESTSSLIETLLTLARADSGSPGLRLELIDLRDVAMEAADEWRRATVDRGLQFDSTIGPADLPVFADRDALRRLLNILLDNAMKYTLAPGRIELFVAQVEHLAVISVRDSGIGIHEDDRKRIFDRFYRADKARSREVIGAGLGLAIAQWIVEQHGGSIRVESALHIGSEFTVEFKLQPSSSASPDLSSQPTLAI